MPEREAGGTIRDLLLASGDVGHDLLAVDWSRTPVGPPEAWSQSLRTVVEHRPQLALRRCGWRGARS